LDRGKGKKWWMRMVGIKTSEKRWARGEREDCVTGIWDVLKEAKMEGVAGAAY
jgi:hypothetical protein